MNTKILAGVTIASISLMGFGTAFANSTTPASIPSTTQNTTHKEKHQNRMAEEAIIDKLLAGQTLTAEEEKLRAEIIKKRAEKKAEREQIKNILEKKKTGQTLTTEEENLLKNHNGRHGGGMHRNTTPPQGDKTTKPTHNINAQ